MTRACAHLSVHSHSNESKADEGRGCYGKKALFFGIYVLACAFRSQLHLDVDAGGQIECHEAVDGLRGHVVQVQKALVRLSYFF